MVQDELKPVLHKLRTGDEHPKARSLSDHQVDR